MFIGSNCLENFNTDETQIEYEKELIKIQTINTKNFLFDQFLNGMQKL